MSKTKRSRFTNLLILGSFATATSVPVYAAMNSAGEVSPWVAHAEKAGPVADSKQIQQIVERAVAQVLDQQLPKLQAALVERVLAELPAQPAAAPASGHSVSGNLAQAVSSIHAGTTQKEILRALLDAGSSCASRVALFVVKAGAASGWQSRGLGNDEVVKDFTR